jgi:hypothetical protein
MIIYIIEGWRAPRNLVQEFYAVFLNPRGTYKKQNRLILDEQDEQFEGVPHRACRTEDASACNVV